MFPTCLRHLCASVVIVPLARIRLVGAALLRVPIITATRSMEKISKLRRKPKPPAIETSVDRHINTNTPYEVDNTEADAGRPQRVPMMPSRLSPFRKLRGSAKRARSASPAPGQMAQNPAAVVGQDGMPPNSRGNAQRVPKIPYFLTLTDYGKLHA